MNKVAENIRDRRQQEFANVWLDRRWGILLLCPRFGKTRVATIILKDFKPDAKVLIAYPDEKIKASWEDEFSKTQYSNPNVILSTHLSLKKYKDEKFDVVIVDEIHRLSENQINVCKEMFSLNKHVLGLTGTLSSETEHTLFSELNLVVIASYPIEQAIEEGVISNYHIIIVKVSLDKHKKIYKGKSEKQKFDSYSYVIEKLEEEKKDTLFLRLARMRVIQNSIAKLNKTKELIEKENRCLIFCGTTSVADRLGVPSYHSKSSEKTLFEEFVSGEGKHLAVCKIGATGITFHPLSSVIINYFSSNEEDFVQKILRSMSYEYDNPEKKAIITIVSSNEEVELKWLKRALKSLNPKKISYINS